MYHAQATKNNGTWKRKHHHTYSGAITWINLTADIGAECWIVNLSNGDTVKVIPVSNAISRGEIAPAAEEVRS